MTSPSSIASTSRTNISVSVPPLKSKRGASASDMRFGARCGRCQDERAAAHQCHSETILRSRLRLEREFFDQAFEDRWRVLPVLQLQNHLPRQHELSFDARELRRADRCGTKILIQRQPRGAFSRSRKAGDAVV